MTSINKKQILDKISHIVFLDNSSVLDKISDILIKNYDVGFSLDITSISIGEANKVRKNIIDLLSDIPNIGKISVVLTENKNSRVTNNGINNTDKRNYHDSRRMLRVDGVDKIIVIASGKGGVGKSTISSLIATKLSNLGAKIGILDADIYGPSIPRIFGLTGKPELSDNRMIPLVSNGIVINSVDFLVAPGASISWRGPMVSKVLYQLLSLTKWNDLDYLIIDMPPGTGDIHLSLLQNYNIDNSIIITTPQVISMIDVFRIIDLYKKFDINIFGVIENMSYYQGDNSGKRIQIFTGNSGEQIVKKYNIGRLVKLPIITDLSTTCDSGKSLSQFIHILNSLDLTLL